MSGYFDHNATAPLHPAARDAWLAATERFWHNPSSLYGEAAAAKGRYIRQITITTTMGPGIHIDPSKIRGIVEELEEQAEAVPA